MANLMRLLQPLGAPGEEILLPGSIIDVSRLAAVETKIDHYAYLLDDQIGNATDEVLIRK